MKEVTDLRTRTDKKLWVQEMIMHGVGNVLGYWTEGITDGDREKLGEDGIAELRELFQREADRLAKVFGFESAWSN